MQKPLLLKITGAHYEHDYVLRLTFNTGEVKLCDFEPLSRKGIGTKLQDMKYFKSFRLDPFTVDWNNEIGFAPEYLYEISTEVSNSPHMVADTTPIDYKS